MTYFRLFGGFLAEKSLFRQKQDFPEYVQNNALSNQPTPPRSKSTYHKSLECFFFFGAMCATPFNVIVCAVAWSMESSPTDAMK